MRNLILFQCLLVLWLSTNAQSLKDLDAKNGFKTVKIGDKIAKYNGSITFLNKEDKSLSSWYEYKPVDKDLYNVFNTQFNQILLLFDKNENLVEICLHRSINGDNSFKDAIAINQELEKYFIYTFGTPSTKIDEEHTNPVKMGLCWIGSKIYLESCVLYHGMTIEDGIAHTKPSDLAILICDIKYFQNLSNSGF